MIFKDPSAAARILAPIFAKQHWVWWSDEAKQFCPPSEAQILEEFQRLANNLVSDLDRPFRIETGRLAVEYCQDTKEFIYQLDSASEGELT